jgi:hypothetical protein
MQDGGIPSLFEKENTMAQASGFLPKLSRLAGKALTSTWEHGKAGTKAAAKGGARLAGECAREFVSGLAEGKTQAKLEAVLATPEGQRLLAQAKGDTDGDLTCSKPSA